MTNNTNKLLNEEIIAFTDRTKLKEMQDFWNETITIEQLEEELKKSIN